MQSCSTSRRPPTAELQGLIRRAVARRRPLAASGDTTAYRLVNRGGDGLPEMAADRFGEVAILNLFDPAEDPEPYALALADAVPELRSIYVKRRPAGEERDRLAASEQWAPRQPA